MVFSGETSYSSTMEDMRTNFVHVWVKFHNLHFSLWSPQVLSKVASYLGTHIKTDKLTAVRGKTDYVRMLIDVKITESLPEYIPIKSPNGMSKKRVEFEWKPLKCNLWGKIGHAKEECKKAVDAPVLEIAKVVDTTSEVVVVIVEVIQATSAAPIVVANAKTVEKAKVVAPTTVSSSSTIKEGHNSFG